VIPEEVSLQGTQVGRFEVTQAQYAQFDPSRPAAAGRENHPGKGITFEQARNYCAWLSAHDRLVVAAGIGQDPRMTADQIQIALADVTAEGDPALKHLKLASVVSGLFREQSIELVVVGGSAIEFYTEGAYVSGDLDLCLVSPPRLDVRTRQGLMGRLGARGGPRNWQVAGQYVDILGEVETLARTPFAVIEAPYGQVRLVSPEDLLVERLLISVYPQRDEVADACARKLMAVALAQQVELDWQEARRLAARPEYGVLPVLEAMVREVAHELGTANPYHS
jgi:hypothetical protein